MRRHFGTAAFCALTLAGCSTGSPSTSAAGNATDAPDPSAAVGPVPAPPQPHFQEREGDRYLYVTAVSDEDRRRGQAVGTVLQYRYLGEKDGVLRLEQVTEAGVPIGQLECHRDCRIMKFTAGGAVSRIPFDPQSVAGSAMDDALNGLLEPARAPAAPAVARAIPARFLGSWQSRVSECGTGLDDSVVVVEPRRVSFYESSLEPSRIEIVGASQVKVTGELGDETGGTATMSYTLRLSGGALTVDDSVRRFRCPSP